MAHKYILTTSESQRNYLKIFFEDISIFIIRYDERHIHK